jgi:alpha-beta hydrolase superfamily lysophospholipase
MSGRQMSDATGHPEVIRGSWRRERTLGLMAAAALAPALLPGAPAGAVAPLPPDDPSTLETVTPRLTRFYAPPRGAFRGGPGELVRARRLAGRAGVRAWRILYRSREAGGRMRVVSGIVLAPVGRAPRAGFPVIAFAHGTTGVNRRCGVSQTPYRPRTPGFSMLRRFWAHFLNAGFAVVATDYQGMGGPGPVAYLVGATNARNVLDAVRAARRLARSVRGVPALRLRRIVTYGNSEGGQASAFAGQVAPSYAPDVSVTGAVVSAPANPPDTASQIDFYRSLPPNPLSGYATMLAYAWGQVYREQGMRAAQTVTPAAARRFADLRSLCADAAAATFTLSPARYLLPPGPSYRTYFRLAAENQPGRVRSAAPVLLLQGLADVVVPPASTDQVFGRMCARGTRVAYRRYAGADHKGVVAASVADALAWARARLAGAPAASDCRAG